MSKAQEQNSLSQNSTRKQKTNKHSTKSLTETKKWYDEYPDVYAFKTTPVSEVLLDRLFQELLDWAESNEDALKITEFFLRKRIGSDTVARFRARDKKYDDAYNHALQLIGNRREIGALKRKLDSGIVAYTMAHYDPSWVKLAEWRAALKKESEGQQGNNITVVMETFPSSELVPQKRISKESE